MSAPSVFIIEDEPRLREVLSDALRQWGMTSTAARSGEEALRTIDREHAADILLLDLNLPGMDGLEALRQLRQKGIDAPAIILTGFGDLAAAQRGIELGIVAFLTKPCRLGELEQAIDRARRQLKPDLPIVLPEAFESPTASGKSAGGRLEDMQRQHILSVLQKNEGNRTATAKELGISRRTLQYRLAEYERDGYIRPD